MHKNVTTIVFVALTFFLLRPLVTPAQVVINEICPSNVTVISNASGNFDDWIEIYNPGNSSINLEGYAITDDINEPAKFVFPSVNIPVGQRMLIFASDENHYPVDHYEMAVNGTGTFSYSPGYPLLDSNWRNTSFNDQAWHTGAGGIGFSDGDDGTEVPVCVSIMMRRSFNITDTSALLNAIFMMDYDDGFVAYLNGVEFARANMPENSGRPSWNTLALVTHEAQMFSGDKPDSIYLDKELVKSLIVPGLNVLAVEVHDYSTYPTDMSSKPYLFFGITNSNTYFPAVPSWFIANPDYFQTGFKMRSAGETVYLLNPAGAVIDQQIYWQLSKDHTYGRVPDGANDWCYINTPSPGLSNNSSDCFSGYAGSPTFTPDGGYRSGNVSVSLDCPQGGVIRYTTNGDEPTLNAPVFSNPVNISMTTTIRARVYDNGVLPGPVVSKTYLINEDSHLPVFSISTDSSNLWDHYTGIFALGPNANPVTPYFGANFWEHWTKPASIEYFDKSHQRLLSFNADIEIYGNYSRAKPQKSLEIRLHDYYGQGEITIPLITDKPYVKNTDRLILRNSGTDYNFVHFRDPFMQRLMKNTHADYVASEPVKVFLNGEMWGVYMLTEKHNQNWISSNYGYDKEEIHFIEEVGTDIVTGIGSNESFLQLYDFMVNHNPADSSYFNKVERELDIKNFVDYIIAETFYNNGDWIGEWTNNIKIWRPKQEYGKWRYLMIDLDYGCGLKGSLTDNRIGLARNPIEFSHTSDMFDALLQNTQFRNYFINRYADLMNTIYLPANADQVMKSFRDSMAFDMDDHFSKWNGDTTTWKNRINTMMNWVSGRLPVQRNHIKSEFNLTGEVLLTLDVSPPGAGRIEISTVVPKTLPWSGIYFNGNPVTITAIPNPGYSFDHWSSNATISNDYKQRTTYNFTADDQITAHFNGSPQPVKLTISEINYNSSDAYQVEDWIEFHNYGNYDLDVSEWKFGQGEEHTNFVFPVGTVIPANGYLVLPTDTLKFKALFPNVANRLGQLEFKLKNSGDHLFIIDYNNNIYLEFGYDDNNPWPELADGLGYTIEQVDPNVDLNDSDNWFSGCFGGSPGKAYSQNLSTLIDIIGNNYFCTGDSTTLTTIAVPDYQYHWKLNGIEMPGITDDSIDVNETGIYQLTIDNFGCTGVSPDFVLTEKTPAPEPTVVNGYRCNKGAVELFASSNETISWFDKPGGRILGQGPKFITLNLSEPATYYVRAGFECPSSEVPVLADVNKGDCGELIVYPNPSRGTALVFHHDLLQPGEAGLIISDMRGSVFYDAGIVIEPAGDSTPMNLFLSNGIYNVTLYQDEEIFNTKMVIVD